MTEPIYEAEALIAEDIDAYLERHQHKTMLRFITCGSVDDGKSTLIGRLLYDTKTIFAGVFFSPFIQSSFAPQAVHGVPQMAKSSAQSMRLLRSGQ